MAIAGRRPKAQHTKALGKNEKVSQPNPDPAAHVPDDYSNKLPPPKGVKADKEQLRLWRTVIQKAYWLTEFDCPRAHMWVALHAEFEADPTKFNGAKIGQLRFIGSELGLDPVSRNRMGIQPPATFKPEESEFFD